jgi:hypothetical protein
MDGIAWVNGLVRMELIWGERESSEVRNRILSLRTTLPYFGISIDTYGTQPFRSYGNKHVDFLPFDSIPTYTNLAL